MVITGYSKICTRIFQNTANIFKVTHWAVTYHYCNVCRRAVCTVNGNTVNASGPVCAVTVIILISDFVNTGIFKHEWCINHFCIPIYTSHIVTKFYNSCTFRIADKVFFLSIGITNTTKIKVAGSVIVNQNCRVKEPSNFRFCAAGNGAVNNWFANRIRPRTGWAVCRQYTNTACVVRKIQEEFLFAVNLLMTYCRCP